MLLPPMRTVQPGIYPEDADARENRLVMGAGTCTLWATPPGVWLIATVTVVIPVSLPETRPEGQADRLTMAVQSRRGPGRTVHF